MDIEIIIKDLMDSVDEEISRIAGSTYDENGTPLYDGLKKTSRDDNTITKILSEALAVVQGSIARFVESAEVTADEIIIQMSMTERRRRAKEFIITTTINSSLAKLVIAKYFSEKQQTELASKFDELAAADLQTLRKNLYEKAAPTN